MEQQIVTALDVPAVTAILGNRIYLHFAPEVVDTPYCRFFEVVAVGVTCLSGADPYRQRRYQFDFFGDVTSELRTSTEAVLTALDDAFTLGAYQTRQLPTDEPGIFHFLLDVTFHG